MEKGTYGRSVVVVVVDVVVVLLDDQLGPK